MLNHNANSPRATDGRSVTSEDTRSDSGKSEEDGELYDATSPALLENAVPAVIRVRKLSTKYTTSEYNCIWKFIFIFFELRRMR